MPTPCWIASPGKLGAIEDMADNVSKLNRTWLCSVLFLDIVNYSSQSVELQIKWKERFNGYLASAIKNVPEDERVILDTGDGAATCFLGAPEAAMFSALELWHSLLLDEREQQPPFKVRIGINLGPVKLVRDINGAPNAIGDGMNAGQRVMSFAGENQILVSQSYFEVVSRLSDDYKNLFSLKGVETDKHIREHTVYHLSPPGVQHAAATVEPREEAALPAAAAAAPPRSATPSPAAMAAQAAPQGPSPAKTGGNRALPLVIGAVVLVLAAAAVAWHFAGSSASENESASVSTSESVSVSKAPVAATPAPAAAAPAPVAQTPAPVAAPVATPPPSAAPAAKPVVATPAPAPAPVAAAPSIPRARPAVASAPAAEEPPPAPRRTGDMPFATSPPVLRDVPAADRDTARDLRERYTMDAGRAATAWKNAEIMRRELSAKGMSLNAQTASSLDNLGLFLDEAADAMREHKWDDALNSLQAVETATQKVAKAVGN